jgi:hypothetical protein
METFGSPVITGCYPRLLIFVDVSSEVGIINPQAAKLTNWGTIMWIESDIAHE